MTATEKVIQRLTRIKNNYQETNLVQLSIPQFQEAFNGGFRKGGLYFLGGKEAVGKTTFFVSLAANLGIRRFVKTVSVGVISLDQTPEEWIERTITNTSDIPLGRISNGNLSESEFKYINDKHYYNLLEKIALNESCDMTIVDIETKIREWAINMQMEIIFINSLHSIQSINPNETEFKKATSYIRVLKKIAVELNIAIFVSATIKTNSEIRESLQKKDIRNIAPIEEMLDFILFMQHPAYLFEESAATNDSCGTRFTILKNNYGALNSFVLKAVLHKQGFCEMGTDLKLEMGK